MRRTVMSYCETVSGVSLEVAEDEAITLLRDTASQSDTIRLIAWLRGLEIGIGDPMPEPDIASAHPFLKYRCQGASAVIFWINPANPEVVDVLRFASCPNGRPLSNDIDIAAERLKIWRDL